MVEIRFDALIDVDNYFLPNLNTLRRCRCEMPVLTHTLSGPCYLPLSVTARLSSPHLTYAAHSRTGAPAINSSYLPEPVATSYLHIFYRLPCCPSVYSAKRTDRAIIRTMMISLTLV